MNKILNYQKIFFTLLVFASLTGNALAFEAKLSPENPKGGEGIWVTIDGKGLFKYKIFFNGKIYKTFKRKNGTKGVLIPLAIRDKGNKDLLIKEKFLFLTLSKKHYPVNISKRKIKVFHLSKKYTLPVLV